MKYCQQNYLDAVWLTTNVLRTTTCDRMLIIVESPAKAKTIKQIVGAKYKVEASVGHIRSISQESKTKDGRKLEISGIDIEHEFAPIYVVDEGKKDVVARLRKLAKEEKEILFATDSDREGEAISWHLAEVLGIKDKKSLKRLEFHEITKTAINEALANPRPLNESLVEAQQARQVLDKLVGFGLSPVLWTVMGNRNLSAGRVQSPALYLIYLREKEIQNFKPVEYWIVNGQFDDTKNTVATLQKMETGDKIPDSDQIFALKSFAGEKIKEKIENAELAQKLESALVKNTLYSVSNIDSREQKNSPRPPFTTSTLQQAASSRLGFSPKQTMSVAQKLYEGITIDGQSTGLITYMRTDSLNLSADSITSARQYITKKYPQFLPEKAQYYRGKSKNAQEAHEAIRPTDPSRTPESIQSQVDSAQFRLYDLIWRQTIASQMTAEIRTITTFDLKNEVDTIFSGSMSVQKSAGFRAIQPMKQSEKSYNLAVGDTLYLDTVFQKHDFTTPPARYSAASLIKMLEQLGIGRPSTYASIISTLQDRTYVEIAEKSMVPSTLGMKIGELLGEHFAQVTSSELTAQMEDNLDEISNGTKHYAQVLGDFWHPFKQQIELKKVELGEIRQQYKTVGGESIQDPAGVGGEMILKIGRFGEYWQSVSDPKIMYPKNFREIAVALAEAKKLYSDKVADLVSPVSGDPLTIRVSKASLNAYVATEKYTVGSTEKALSIAVLEEKGWSQEVVAELYQKSTKASGGKKFGKGRRFFKKK